MKRVLSMLLCCSILFGLCACARDVQPRETSRETEPALATFPHSATTLSEESVVVTPQTGDYTESTLLANVTGQGAVALLSVRQDGTVDYIFYTPGEKNPGNPPWVNGVAYTNSLVDSEFRYYTIAPDGQATLQPAEWMNRLDEVLAAGLDGAPADAVWSVGFSANAGTIFIVCNLHSADGPLQTVLYRLRDNQLTQVPLQKTYELDGKPTGAGLGQLEQVYASGETFLLDAHGGETSRYLAITYSGEAVAAQVLDPEDVFYICGVGDEIAWFTGAKTPKLTALRTDDFTRVAEYYPEAQDYIFCSESAPDGAYLYALVANGGCGQKRLVRYSGDGEEILIDTPDLYAFGSPSCTCKALAASNDGLVYLWSKENGQGALRQYRYNPEDARETETVTVYSLEDSQTVRAAVSRWNRSHNDITFAYVIASREIESSAMTMDDAITQLNTQLVNGEGPDVLILDGLPVDGIIDKGFLHPLTELDTTGVYENLLERFTVDGALYAVPARMTPYLLGRKLEGTEPIDSLEDFADYVEAATEKLNCVYMAHGDNRDDLYKKALYYVNFTDQIFDLWYPAWSEAIWKDGAFHGDVYQELLTQTNRLAEHYSLRTMDDLLTEYEENAKTGLSKTEYTIINETDTNSHTSHTYPYCLAATNYVGMRNFVPGAFFLDNWNPEPIPCEIVGIPGPEGTGVTVPTCIAAVREGGNTQAGLEFLRLLLSDEVQLEMGDAERYSVYSCDGYPVKWSCTPALLEFLETDRMQEFAIENDFQAALSELRPVILYDIPYTAAKEAALRFYEGALTAQEAADQVASATALYLAEQRR